MLEFLQNAKIRNLSANWDQYCLQKCHFLAGFEDSSISGFLHDCVQVDIGELQQELVHLVNGKAELADQLEDYRRRLDTLGSRDGEITGLQALLR